MLKSVAGSVSAIQQDVGSTTGVAGMHTIQPINVFDCFVLVDGCGRKYAGANKKQPCKGTVDCLAERE